MNAAILLTELKSQGLTLAVAESCTGGLLASRLTDVPGASAAFCGGVIAYGDHVKEAVLGVERAQLEKFGAVSGSVVEKMAHSVRDMVGADVAIAISGIAGPGGAVGGKEVGTVWIAVLGPGHLLDVHRVHINGDRQTVREGAVDEAIAMTLDALTAAAKH